MSACVPHVNITSNVADEQQWALMWQADNPSSLSLHGLALLFI